MATTWTTGQPTPWGVADHVEEIAHGIVSVSTPSHGGVYLSPERNEKVPLAWREASFGCLGLKGWYEEDCDWCLAALEKVVAYAAEHLDSDTLRDALADVQTAITTARGG